MADNPNVAGVPQPVAADDDGGNLFQRVKITGVTTTVAAIAAAAGAVPLLAANAKRRKCLIHFDADPTEKVLILEGGAGPVSAANWSFPLWGGQTYEAFVPSVGAYMAWWDDQGAPAGTLHVTQG